MKFILGSLLPFLLLHPLAVLSDELNDCRASPQLSWIKSDWPHYNLKTCECASELKKYGVKPPVGINLIAVCDYRAGENGNESGGFYFMGNLDITGEIDRQEHVSGITINFHTHEKFTDDRFTYGVRRLKFANENEAIKLLKTPRITDEQPCWKAAATIRIKKVLVLEGGTDEAGGWLVDYEVINIGTYTKCIPHP